MIFSAVLNYDEYLDLLGFKSLEEISILMIITGQLIRGILLGIVIWWIKDSILGKKLAWLKLWAILVIVGIIAVYGPAPLRGSSTLLPLKVCLLP
jgi:hypothetical protein